MPKGRLTLEQRSNDDLNWIRSYKPNSEKEDEPTLVALSNLAGITILRAKPLIEGLSKTREDAIDWLCKNSPNLDDVEEATMAAFTNPVKCHCQ